MDCGVRQVQVTRDEEEILGVDDGVERGKGRPAQQDHGLEQRLLSYLRGGVWIPESSGLFHVLQNVLSAVRPKQWISTAERGNGSLVVKHERLEGWSHLV